MYVAEGMLSGTQAKTDENGWAEFELGSEDREGSESVRIGGIYIGYGMSNEPIVGYRDVQNGDTCSFTIDTRKVRTRPGFGFDPGDMIGAYSKPIHPSKRKYVEKPTPFSPDIEQLSQNAVWPGFAAAGFAALVLYGWFTTRTQEQIDHIVNILITALVLIVVGIAAFFVLWNEMKRRSIHLMYLRLRAWRSRQRARQR